MYQYGITADTSDWLSYFRQLREWLTPATGPTSIPYRIEGLNPKSVWRRRFGQTNQHNGRVPRDFWLTEEENKAILDYQELYPQEGYRRLTYMMMDADIVAVSPSSVFRVLRKAGRLRRWAHRVSKKGTGFDQPLRPHVIWCRGVCGNR